MGLCCCLVSDSKGRKITSGRIRADACPTGVLPFLLFVFLFSRSLSCATAPSSSVVWKTGSGKAGYRRARYSGHGLWCGTPQEVPVSWLCYMCLHVERTRHCWGRLCLFLQPLLLFIRLSFKRKARLFSSFVMLGYSFNVSCDPML